MLRSGALESPNIAERRGETLPERDAAVKTPCRSEGDVSLRLLRGQVLALAESDVLEKAPIAPLFLLRG